MCVPVKAGHIRRNMSDETATLSRTVYEPIAIEILHGDPPQFGEEVELEGRMWHYVKARHIRHNLSVESETLSLSI